MSNDLSRRSFLRTSGQMGLASAFWRYGGPLAATPQPITLAAVGDCMISRPLSVLPPDSFLPLAAILRGADVSFGNFEMTLAGPDASPAYHETCAYVHLRADTPGDHPLPEELKWAGLKLMGLSNNHSMDYGADGLLTTIEKFDLARLTHAGTGRDLAEARSPAYWDSPKGRVALVSCASTFPYGSFAADGNGEVPGRPGLNPLRFQTTYQVTAEEAASLKKISGGLGSPSRASNP
ncbi:MAG: CapA family protein, partial [Bryobacteraceae bacterium]